MIPADRVETNVELSQILADLFPLLRAVQPADLNATLNALATALEGRGEQLGETLDELDAYLGAIDDHLPTLRAGPDQARRRRRHLRPGRARPARRRCGNLTVTSKTIVEKPQRPRRLLLRPRAAWPTPRPGSCRDNEQNLIRVGRGHRAGAAGCSRIYSPEFPCLLKGAAKYAPRLAKTFEGNEVKQYIEFGTAQYRGLRRARPPGVRRGRARPLVRSACRTPRSRRPGAPLDDGTRHRREPAHAAPMPDARRAPPDAEPRPAATPARDGEQAIVNALLAGRRPAAPADTYGALGSLLYGPVVAGEATGERPQR